MITEKDPRQDDATYEFAVLGMAPSQIDEAHHWPPGTARWLIVEWWSYSFGRVVV